MLAERPLIVFDIDGTLTESVPTHQAAFVTALERFGFSRVDTNWSGYEHLTDSYIFHANVEAHEARPPSEAERASFEALFTHAYEEALADARTLPTPGARELLSRLAEANVPFCFATGSYRSAAEVKLRHAFQEIPLLAPLATASEALTREDIVRLAIEKAQTKHGVTSFSRVVSVGDGAWDLRTASRLGLDFVGLARGEPRAQLLLAGANVVVETFEDPAWRALERELVRAR